MANPTQSSLLAEDAEAVTEEVSPLKPIPRSLKRVLMPNRNQLEFGPLT